MTISPQINPTVVVPAEAPAGFRYYTPMTIRYGDMDTLGHVNNAKYLTYCEHARVSYFNDLQIWNGEQSAVGAIIARITMDYKLPLTIRDGTVEIWTRTSRLGTKSFDLENIVITRRDGAPVIAALCTTVTVCFDYVNNTSVVLPDAWRTKMLAYEPALKES
ncbi:MAG TPA: thioesterase family protein [Phototrophicaceae bacterium]|jgi:acyl-CoA thioester hydrolase|nr:thioesterase family protein [Phototrophicaceae bacterium]